MEKTMGAKSLKPSAASLYDEDFAAWTSETARQLRAGRFAEIDIEHVAEEIEDMGKSEKRELLGRLTVLVTHLLKWKWQADKRTASWQSTMATQPAEIQRLLRQSPSLSGVIAASVADVYPDAVESASIETGLPAPTFPEKCPFSVDEILQRGFFPA
jgi:Domain of unknown function DUF29